LAATFRALAAYTVRRVVRSRSGCALCCAAAIAPRTGNARASARSSWQTGAASAASRPPGAGVGKGGLFDELWQSNARLRTSRRGVGGFGERVANSRCRRSCCDSAPVGCLPHGKSALAGCESDASRPPRRSQPGKRYCLRSLRQRITQSLYYLPLAHAAARSTCSVPAVNVSPA
jgi:hypothetical protein